MLPNSWYSVPDYAPPPDHLADQEEYIRLGGDDRALGELLELEFLESIEADALDGVARLRKLFGRREGHAFFGVHLLCDLGRDLGVIDDGALEG